MNGPSLSELGQEFLSRDRGCFGFQRGDLVSVLALLLYSLKLLSLPSQLRTLPVNLFLLLLLHFLVALELVSNKSTSSRSERTTDESPRNGMANGTAYEAASSGSPQSPNCCAFLCSAHARAAKKSHYEW
jgi:hypothetical protein